MEFNCPECGKRLRAPEHLRNPLVRCPACGTMFRPREGQADEALPTFAPPDPEPRPTARPDIPKPLQPRPQPFPSQSSGRGKGKGLGIGMLILIIVLFKGAKLVRHLIPDRPPPQPAPMRIDPKQMQMLRDLERGPHNRDWPVPQPAPVQIDPKQIQMQIQMQMRRDLERARSDRDRPAPPAPSLNAVPGGDPVVEPDIPLAPPNQVKRL